MSTPGRIIAYRPDIDGLRAIAVLAVVFFHLEIGPLHSGFVGVDIFFVISGYLITGIIQREIEQGRFTFAGFYHRRIRRLFPALFVVLLFTLLVGLLVLLPSDLTALGKGITATLLLGSNILFWRSSGYFAGTSDINPLLHMWSLSVEEQFYIGLPLLLLLVHRYAGNHLRSTLVVCTLASLGACVTLQALKPSAVFFLSPFRAWELLAGALLAVGAVPAIAGRWLRELLSWVALVLLLASLVWIEPGIAFPGWQAMIPVIATAVLLHVGGSGGSLVHALLRLKLLVFFGLISYSLYLWHWPLLVFAKYSSALEPLGYWRWGLLVLSVVLATLSYRWVEQPFRSRGGLAKPPRLLFQRAALASGVLAVLALAMVSLRGVPARFDDSVVALDQARTSSIRFRECMDRSVDMNRAGNFCVLGDAGAKPRMMVWGDSYALAWAPAFDELLRKQGKSALLATDSSCPPLADVQELTNLGCHQVNAAVIGNLGGRSDIQTVVMIASWTSYSDAQVFPAALKETVETLQGLGKRVWIIGPTPGAPSDILFRLAMVESMHLQAPRAIRLADFAGRAAGFDSAVRDLLASDGVFYTDPRPWFCAEGLCRYKSSGRVLYRDGGHLSRQGNEYLAPYLEHEISLVQASLLPATIKGFQMQAAERQ